MRIKSLLISLLLILATEELSAKEKDESNGKKPVEIHKLNKRKVAKNVLAPPAPIVKNPRKWNPISYQRFHMRDSANREMQKLYFEYLKQQRKILAHYYRITIETRADGKGAALPVSIKAGEPLLAYAILRNKKGKFIRNENVIWEVNKENASFINSQLGSVRYGKFVNILGQKTGLAGLKARHRVFGEVISDLLIEPGLPDKVILADENGSEIKDLSVKAGSDVKLYPNLYDKFGNFAGTAINVTVNFSGDFSGASSQDAFNVIHFEGHKIGHGSMSVNANGQMDSIENVAVNPGDADHLNIENAVCDGSGINIAKFNIGDSADYYACIKDVYDNFVSFGLNGVWSVIGGQGNEGLFVGISNGVHFTAAQSCNQCAVAYEEVNLAKAFSNYFSIVSPIPMPKYIELAEVSDPLVNSCIGIEVQLTNDNGLIATDVSRTAYLNASSGVFYLDAACSNAISSVIILAQSSKQKIYYKSSVAQVVYLSASSVGLQSVILDLTVESPLIVNPLLRTLSAGFNQSCSLVNNEMKCAGNGMSSFANVLNADGSHFNADKLSRKVGYDHNCAINGQTVYCWGKNTYGQLGNSNNVDSQFPVASSNIPSNINYQINEIDISMQFTCIRENNVPKCWGINSSAQLGIDPSILQSRNVVAVIPSISNLPVTQVAIGLNSTCFLYYNYMYCWGGNEYGQLAQPSYAYNYNLQLISGVPLLQRIASNEYQTCAVSNTNQVYCWGSGAIKSSSPVQIVDIAGDPIGNVSTVAIGGSHVCMLTVNGYVYCIGSNEQGQLGLGDKLSRPYAERVNISKITELVAGSSHTCAKNQQGQVYCWGANDLGQLGTGDLLQHLSPSLALGL